MLLNYKIFLGTVQITVLADLTDLGLKVEFRNSVPITHIVGLYDPNQNPLGGCGSPINPTTGGACQSTTTPPCNVTQDMATSTTTLEVPAGYITNNPSLSGSWTFTHGTEKAEVVYDQVLGKNFQLVLNDHSFKGLGPYTWWSARIICLFSCCNSEPHNSFKAQNKKQPRFFTSVVIWKFRSL